MDAPKTIRELLKATQPWLQKKGVAEARLDAELLVAHALKVRRIDLFLDLDRPMSDSEIAQCRALVLRRGQREPLAHIVGAREFFGHPYRVNSDVLIPRQDTEALVELALENIDDDAEGVFVDACTGTGCVGIALLLERPGLTAVLTDISPAALAVASVNATALGVIDRVQLRVGDLLAVVTESVQFVVANPPYIRSDEMAALEPDVRDHEPRVALVGDDDDGLGHHRRLLADCTRVVVDGGFAAFEIGHSQGAAARAMAQQGWSAVDVVKDLSRNDRVMFARKNR